MQFSVVTRTDICVHTILYIYIYIYIYKLYFLCAYKNISIRLIHKYTHRRCGSTYLYRCTQIASIRVEVFFKFQCQLSKLADFVEYTDCILAEKWDPTPNMYPRHDTKLPLIAIAPRSTLTRHGSVAPERVLSMGQIELFDIYTACK